MPEPKKQTTKRGTGLRRSHIRLNLAKRVNKTSPVKVFTTAKQSGKKLSAKKTVSKSVKPKKTKSKTAVKKKK